MGGVTHLVLFIGREGHSVEFGVAVGTTEAARVEVAAEGGEDRLLDGQLAGGTEGLLLLDHLLREVVLFTEETTPAQIELLVSETAEIGEGEGVAYLSSLPQTSQTKHLEWKVFSWTVYRSSVSYIGR